MARVTVGYAGARITDDFDFDVPEDGEFVVQQGDSLVSFLSKDSEGGDIDRVTINMAHVAYFRVLDTAGEPRVRDLAGAR